MDSIEPIYTKRTCPGCGYCHVLGDPPYIEDPNPRLCTPCWENKWRDVMGYVYATDAPAR